MSLYNTHVKFGLRESIEKCFNDDIHGVCERIIFLSEYATQYKSKHYFSKNLSKIIKGLFFNLKSLESIQEHIVAHHTEQTDKTTPLQLHLQPSGSTENVAANTV